MGMAKVIDLSGSDGDFVIIGKSLVLPNSDEDSLPTPLNGALRFNPTLNAVESFSNGVWTNLAGSGGGGSGSTPSSVTIAQVIGLNTALSNKASVIHSHAITNIIGLVNALAGKSDVGHQHVINDVTGLQTSLDNKSDIGHQHQFIEDERIAACLPGSPPSSFKLVWVSTATVNFPTNLTGSSFNLIHNPAAPFVITIFKNISTNLGTITISPTGSISISIAAFSVSAGDSLTFSFPARDISLDTLTIAILGARAPQTIA